MTKTKSTTKKSNETSEKSGVFDDDKNKPAAEKESKEASATFNTERNPAIRITMMPRDTNAHGTVFGGIILSYIDVAGSVHAVRHTGHDRFVTVAMKEVIFHEPVFVGDLVSFYAEAIRVGNSSITVKVDVEAQRFGSHNQLVQVTEAEVVYVAINQYREKVKIKKDE